MLDSFKIQSHRGMYEVRFDEAALEKLDAAIPEGAHFIIDERLSGIYAREMKNILSSHSVLEIEATERSKSLDRFQSYIEHLVGKGVRRGHVLIAVGGGVIQDTTSFLAATMMRGLDWRFLPTTLLAQADSCIGSKSSINVGTAKNILGTFTPPSRIDLSTQFLSSLSHLDQRSGVGEMLKVHAIDGPESFDTIAAAYDEIFADRSVMRTFLYRSLMIKKKYIEDDEFDQGPRLVFNYGHTFGHAIEAATNFAVPHGIAVTMGMDMANWISAELGCGAAEHFERMHPTLFRNFEGFEKGEVPIDAFVTAISKDKKNLSSASVTLILPDKRGRIFRDSYSNDGKFRSLCEAYLTGVRAS